MKRTPLKRGKPLRRQTGMRKVSKRSAKSGGHLFPATVDESYRAFIRTFPCEVALRRVVDGSVIVSSPSGAPAGYATHFCSGPIVCAHVKSRGSSGPDHGNCLPLCASGHEEQHRIGWPAFERRYGIDAKKLAQSYEDYWVASKGEG